MTTAGHIFISYARRDGSDYAQRLDTTLPQFGFNTWRDKRGIDPTQDFTAVGWIIANDIQLQFINTEEDLLVLNPFQDIPILTPRNFLEQYAVNEDSLPPAPIGVTMTVIVVAKALCDGKGEYHYSGG